MATTLSTTATCSQRLTLSRARPPAGTFCGTLGSLVVVILLAGLMILSDDGEVDSGDSVLEVASSRPIAPPSLLGSANSTADDGVGRRGHQATGVNGWLRDRSSGEAIRGGGGHPSQPPSPRSFEANLTSREQAELEQFLADCRNRVDSWRVGRAAYPGTLTIRLHQMATYRVKVDIDASGRQQSPPSDEMRVADLQVRCGIGARLTSVNKSLAIEDGGDWIKREFDTTETVEWVWTVHADRAGAAQVRLDFRPAVEVMHGGRVVPGNEDSGILTETYTSNITVDTAVLDAADNWFKNDFPKIGGITTLIGAAVIALVTWVRKLLRAARDQEDATIQRPSGSPQRAHRRARLRRRTYRTAKARRSAPNEARLLRPSLERNPCVRPRIPDVDT